MKKIQTILLVFLGAAVGFAAGMKYHAHYSDSVELRLRLWESETRADVALRALRHIRSGSTNTVAFLECELDEAAASLGHITADIPPSKRSDEHVRMIRKIKEDRAQFPYASCVNHEKSVARAFSLLEEVSR
jgi:hypothetical protein